MAGSVAEMINEYQNPEEVHSSSEKFAHTFRVDYETKSKIEYISKHFRVRKSPFIAELVTAAINEIFQEIEDDLPGDDYNNLMEDVINYHNNHNQ